LEYKTGKFIYCNNDMQMASPLFTARHPSRTLTMHASAAASAAPPPPPHLACRGERGPKGREMEFNPIRALGLDERNKTFKKTICIGYQ
jgi:hypothetical protein